MLALPLLAPASAAAVDFLWTLDRFVDSGFDSPCASRMRPVQAVNPTCYDTFDDFTPSTGTEFLLTIDAPTLADISDGDTVTLHDFFLPPPSFGDFHVLDYDFASTFLAVGLANQGNGAVDPDTAFVIDELVGTLVETSPGLFAVTFPTLPIYWTGSRPSANLAGSGIFPFSLSTQQTFISVDSTTPAVPGVSPEVPGFCEGGSLEDVGYPNFPLAGGVTDFSPGSNFVLGGATCPSGLSAITNLAERAFSIELQGELVPISACSDGLDNDGDGLFDFVGGDPGCDDASDFSERSSSLPCDNGEDDDGDGWTDFVPDRDGDGIGDFPGDPACRSPGYVLGEDRQCQNGIDDNGDSLIDYDGGASFDRDGDGFIDAEFNPDTPAVTHRSSQCDRPWIGSESRFCGLGAELALLLPPLMWLNRRRRLR
jgi:hypothetical protein